jgi:hypothetical protein
MRSNGARLSTALVAGGLFLAFHPVVGCADCEDVPTDYVFDLPFSFEADGGGEAGSWVPNAQADDLSLEQWLDMPCAEICGRLSASPDEDFKMCAQPDRHAYGYTVWCRYVGTKCRDGCNNLQGG